MDLRGLRRLTSHVLPFWRHWNDPPPFWRRLFRFCIWCLALLFLLAPAGLVIAVAIGALGVAVCWTWEAVITYWDKDDPPQDSDRARTYNRNDVFRRWPWQ